MEPISAIDTEYNGYQFRSRLEARWAVFFDHLQVSYLYEPEGFQIGDKRYLPDFLIQHAIKFYGDAVAVPKLWVEIKPSALLEEADRLKIAQFVRAKREPVLLVAGAPDVGVTLKFIDLDQAGKLIAPEASWIELANEGLGLITHPHLETILNEDTKAAIRRATETPMLTQAYAAAKQARFEHGLGLNATQPKQCASCGKSFVPTASHHYLCLDCFRERFDRVPAEQVPTEPIDTSETRGRLKRTLMLTAVATLVLTIIFGGAYWLFIGGAGANGEDRSVPAFEAVPANDSEGSISPELDAVDEVPGETSALCTCSSNSYDCVDFDTQAEAQACFDHCFSEQGDIHFLDGNEDGQACETLP